MTDHDRGQVDTSGAEIYDSLFVPALFGRFAESIAAAAAVGPDDSVVDIACGTGALTRAVAARTTGPVVGIDLNPGMIEVARARGGGVEYRVGDALALDLADRSFDLATCQFGIMFYPDPVRGLAEMARVAERGAVAVWDSIDRSEGYSAMQELFRDELGDDAAASLDAPFAMGAPGVLEGLCAEAGLADARYLSLPGSGRFDSIERWVTTEVRGWTLGESVSDEQLAELVAVAQERLGRFATADGCEFGMTAKVATWRS